MVVCVIFAFDLMLVGLSFCQLFILFENVAWVAALFYFYLYLFVCLLQIWLLLLF